MTTYYRINSGPAGSVLTLMGDVNYSIGSDSPGYREAAEYVVSTAPEDIDPRTLESLVNPRARVTSYITRVSDRVALRDNTLLFDGDPLHSSLADHIIKLSAEDEDQDPDKLVRFLENLMSNPSDHSREQLYDWLSDRNFTITNDGHFLAYKGLREDYTSSRSGPGTVNSRYYENAHLDNSVGNIVEIARSYVDPDSFQGCSTGLHAGTFEYARGFSSGRLVLVKINPRDVVSVPTDCDAQKLRVARYEVLEDVTQEITSSVYYVDDEDDDEDDWIEDLDDPDYYDEDEDEDDWDDDLEEEEDYQEDDNDSDDRFSHLGSFLRRL